MSDVFLLLKSMEFWKVPHKLFVLIEKEDTLTRPIQLMAN